MINLRNDDSQQFTVHNIVHKTSSTEVFQRELTVIAEFGLIAAEIVSRVVRLTSVCDCEL